MKSTQYLNSTEAANLLGVNVSTIKRWTDNGKLSCIQTPGGHRKFLMKHINMYLKNHGERSGQVSVLPYNTSERRQINHFIQKHKIDDLTPVLMEAALKSDRETVKMIIIGLELAQYPIYHSFDKLLTPVLRKIGELWADNTICVAEEHIASNIIRDSILSLKELILPEEKNAGKAFCFALNDDLHDLPLKMVQVILEQRGFEVYYSGQGTPIESVEPFIDKFRPDRVYISSTIYDDEWTDKIDKSKNYEMDLVYKLSKMYGFKIYIGGQAFNKIDFDGNLIERRLNTFHEVYKY